MIKDNNKKQSMASNRIFSIDKIHSLDEVAFRRKITSMLKDGKRLCAFFAILNTGRKKSAEIYAVIAHDAKGKIEIFSFHTPNYTMKSFTPKHPQFHLFECEIYEQTGILPIGHPSLKPVRFPLNSHFPDENNRVGEINYFKIHGDDIHQVAVGPVHAGIIEPGHFRFQCYGETVHHLEISLGYQHRGIEQHLINGPHKNTIFQMEALSGDATIAHTTAYCNIIEQLTETKVSEYASRIRAIALELERCANHIGDLGAMAGDIGYLPTMSYCGRIRGDFLNITALLCGNRFGRGLLTPGGVKHDLTEERICELRKKVATGKADFINAVSLLWDTPSVLARFEETGVIDTKTAASIGMVGVAARASGLTVDSRRSHPSGIYRKLHINVPKSETGDVFARARIRWHEVIESINIINQLLGEIQEGRICNNINKKCKSGTFAVALVEGWRGEVCHIAVTDKKGEFLKYKVIDPSFHNWLGLALALRGEQISDFPICNKSFSLSYCGFDL